ncbi:MAG TPA: NHL repeat-containing protein [Solirubrobacteraceae bacterium]|jgi:DNA-binding beta-propeller fold protein YncE|nr:NHL repeat-containing protein [Solirubrobacteraceae bacterium]
MRFFGLRGLARLVRTPTQARMRRSARVLLGAGTLLGALATAAAPALAEACAGVGNEPCPYASASIVGQRAEGVLRFPEAVAVDTQGNVYVADQLSYVVQKFSAAGAFETEWGSYGGGHGQFGPIGGLATDAAGYVYVVDSSHNRIEKFDPNGTFIAQWGHKGSEPGEFSFGSSQDYTKPPGGGIAVAGNYVYVADSGNNRIQRFNLEGGEGMEWGTKGAGPGQFAYPRGVAANASEVLVADDDNHRIEKFDPNGAYQSSAGSQGSGPAQFAFPYGVALDATGNVYVADDLGHRVVKLSPELAFLGAWGGYGTKPGQLAFPRAVASDPAGDTYVANTANDRIEVYDPEGRFLRTIGISARGPGMLTGPRGLALDPSGGLLISDTVGSRVELFAPLSDAYVGQWITADGHRSSFAKPSGIGVEPGGNVYVADQGNERIVHLWGDGTYLSEIGGAGNIGGAQLNGADAVAVAPHSGRTYVADAGHNRVLVYGREGKLLARWGAGGGGGAASNAPGAFNHPSGVAVSSVAPGEEIIFVADKGNDRIVKLDANGNVLREWGSRGGGDGRFHAPAGVAVDGAGNVFALDSENNRVEQFGPDGRFISKWGFRGTGLGDFSQPSAIGVDCAGSVYVADTNNNRVERFNMADPAPSGCEPAGTWPPPLDVAPVLRIGLPRSGGVLARHALALSVSCERGCKILVSGALSVPRRGGAVALVAAARSLPRAKAGHVRLRLGPKGLRRLKHALGRHRGMTARVRIVAVGPTGRRTTATRTYAVSR